MFAGECDQEVLHGGTHGDHKHLPFRCSATLVRIGVGAVHHQAGNNQTGGMMQHVPTSDTPCDPVLLPAVQLGQITLPGFAHGFQQPSARHL